MPRLLELFAARGIRATFFFTFGPDRSGVAVRRVLTRPGFLAKMIRSRAPSLYGFRTALYGTLLPAPRIGERCADAMRAAARAGHDTGVHAWDHVRWHDGLFRMTEDEVGAEAERAHAAYRAIFGAPARFAAAAGWTIDARALAVEAERRLLYASNTRLGAPFFPAADGRVFETLEIPTTLPTLDETLAWPSLRGDTAQLRWFSRAVSAGGAYVHTLHAEVEGRSKAPLFAGILDAWRDTGASFPTLAELAEEALSRRGSVPVRAVGKTALPGRGGTVATGWPELASAAPG